MTLTELKYIVALAREKHFGKAAAACFVSQPSLSVGIKKLEQELGVVLFERSMQEVHLTEMGARVVAQAQRVLGEVSAIKSMVLDEINPATGTLHLGIIYSVAPYLLPKLMPKVILHGQDLKLIVQEDYTHKLLERVKQGSLDAAIVALPISESGLSVMGLYDEDFYVALAKDHRLVNEEKISPHSLTSDDALLILGAGHCFRDQVLLANPHIMPFKIEQEGLQKTFEGTSLETLRHMAASGIGVTVLPALAVPKSMQDESLRYLAFESPTPHRRVVLVWRKNYSREAACLHLAEIIRTCGVGLVDGVCVIDENINEGAV